MAESRINVEQVRHVARLARMELNGAEEERLQTELSAILAYIDTLNELDTANVAPTAQVGEAGTPMREDVVSNLPAPDEMLRNAPAREGRFFKVPKIIE
ncbi:MAG: Asp-tRNA(Asn)/Glu-tRNA(Gln) amidotransferase subunit GatC [Candidatus Binataceae bacterium]